MRSVVAAGAVLVAMTASVVAAATPAQAVWPLCLYTVNADDVPVYRDAYPPPQPPVIDRAYRGESFENPNRARYTAPDGTRWRNGYTSNDSHLGYGWVEERHLTLVVCY